MFESALSGLHVAAHTAIVIVTVYAFCKFLKWAPVNITVNVINKVED